MAVQLTQTQTDSQRVSDTIKAVVLQGWAGIHYVAVEIVGETPKRIRVRILEERAKLAGRQRWASYGDIVLVPKYAVVDIDRAAYERSRR